MQILYIRYNTDMPFVCNLDMERKLLVLFENNCCWVISFHYDRPKQCWLAAPYESNSQLTFSVGGKLLQPAWRMLHFLREKKATLQHLYLSNSLLEELIGNSCNVICSNLLASAGGKTVLNQPILNPHFCIYQNSFIVLLTTHDPETQQGDHTIPQIIDRDRNCIPYKSSCLALYLLFFGFFICNRSGKTQD